MRFVIEESSWAWDGADREDYIERIEQVMDRLDVARERDEQVAASRELLAQEILGGGCLMDLLWNHELSLRLPHEVHERVTVNFAMMSYWDDDTEWPAIEVNIAGRDVVSPSAALACERVSRGQATACIALPGPWSGPQDVRVGDTYQTVVHFVVDESSHRAFFQDALHIERANEAGLQALAPHAFPDILFLPDVWDGLRLLEGGYARVRKDLHKFLAVLDSHGAWVFTDETGRLSPREPEPVDKTHSPVTNARIMARFKGWALDVAPEKPDVRDHSRSRRARERVLARRTLYCEWHHKLDPHINRVHIHPPVPESQGKVIVAIIRDHLPLPGD